MDVLYLSQGIPTAIPYRTPSLCGKGKRDIEDTEMRDTEKLSRTSTLGLPATAALRSHIDEVPGRFPRVPEAAPATGRARYLRVCGAGRRASCVSCASSICCISWTFSPQMVLDVPNGGMAWFASMVVLDVALRAPPSRLPGVPLVPSGASWCRPAGHLRPLVTSRDLSGTSSPAPTPGLDFPLLSLAASLGGL